MGDAVPACEFTGTATFGLPETIDLCDASPKSGFLPAIIANRAATESETQPVTMVTATFGRPGIVAPLTALPLSACHSTESFTALLDQSHGSRDESIASGEDGLTSPFVSREVLLRIISTLQQE